MVLAILRASLLGFGLLALAACDAGETTAPGAEKSQATPPVSAEKPAAEKALEAAKQMAPQVPESVASCLELVKAGRYADAVPTCTQALGADPDNAEVKQALEQAQTEAAKAKLGGLR